MTGEQVLGELLARVNACQGEPVVFAAQELHGWPEAMAQLCKAQGLLSRSEPAHSVVCPGCEEACTMPVHWLSEPPWALSFVVCDKRDDINRVTVPPSLVEQWQASGYSIACLLAQMLGLARLDNLASKTARWEIGVVRGKKNSAHMVLRAGEALSLEIAGHILQLDEVLRIDAHQFHIDKKAILRAVDHPVSAAGDSESAESRRKRLRAQVATEKRRGNRAFLKTVARNEGISIQRLKQVLEASFKGGVN